MNHVRFGLIALVVTAAACAPSKDIESPADPPGLDDDGGAESTESESSGEIEAEVVSE